MRQLLRLVVSDGTARKANLQGYEIGGKTGTAEKNINGHYEGKKNISSLLAAFPINDPKYTVFIMVDEPHATKASYGYATAGWVAAPAMARVISSMGPILNINVDKNAPDIAAPLRPFVHKLVNEH